MKTGLITPTVGSSVLATLLSLVVSETAVSRPSAQGPPDLSRLSAEEKAMVAGACNLDRRVNGPAQYYACLRGQLADLEQSPGKPDLSRLSAEEKAMVADACNLDRRINGPAQYYACLRSQLADLERSPGKPDLSRLSAEEKAMVAGACNLDRRINGPAQYYACLRGQLAELGVAITPLKTLREPSKPSEVLTKPRRAPLHNQVSPAPALQGVPTASETPSQPRNEKPDSGSSFLVVIGSIFLLFLLRAGYLKLKTRKCSTCGARTSNATHICNSCQARLNAAETRRQEEQRREAQRQAEDTRRREAEARAEQRRRQEEQDRQKLRTLEDLQRLSGSDFERLIASLFVKDGYRVSPRGGSGDEGIDLILNVGNSKDVVQCKRWKADIGSPIIRDFYGSMMHVGARRGFVITTASFTQSARDFAIGKPITLIDGEYLIAWINGTRSGQQAAAGRSSESDFNPYEVLGVSRGASKDEIRSAYVSLIAKYHPDKVSHLGYEFQAIAREKALAINRAYEMLTHP